MPSRDTSRRVHGKSCVCTQSMPDPSLVLTSTSQQHSHTSPLQSVLLPSTNESILVWASLPLGHQMEKLRSGLGTQTTLQKRRQRGGDLSH